MDNQAHSEYSNTQGRASDLQQYAEGFEDHRTSNPEQFQFVQIVPEPSEPHPTEPAPAPTEPTPPPVQNTFDQLPLTVVKIGFPQLKEAIVNSYMLYKVAFTWNGKDFEISRRFSDFQALRRAIGCILPFTFVFPMHKKQLLVS